MRNIKAAAAIGLLLTAITSAAPSRGASPTADARTARGLVAADSRRFGAMVRGDEPALDRALADELVYVHSSGMRQNKADHLGDVASGRAVYARIDATEQTPALYGEVGLIQGVATFTTGAPGAGRPFTLRYTDMYVWRNGRWQMVAWHCTRIPDQPER